MHETEAYLIDLDGTLANTLPVLYRAYLTFLAQYGKVGCQAEFSEMNGPSLPEVVQQLAKRHQIPVPYPDLYQRYQQLAHTLYVTETPLFPGAREFLEWAKKEEKTLALVTSAERPLARSFVESHDLTDYFSLLVTPEGLPRSKPDPAIYERALDLLGLKAEQCCAVEDSVHGMASAQGAGIPTIFMRHEESSPLLPPEGIRTTVNSWKELYDLL